MTGQRFTVEPCPNGRGFYVRDNEGALIAAGPWPCEGRAAYECDLLRQPVYPFGNGGARRPWDAIGDAVQDNWRRNPWPRAWKGAAA